MSGRDEPRPPRQLGRYAQRTRELREIGREDPEQIAAARELGAIFGDCPEFPVRVTVAAQPVEPESGEEAAKALPKRSRFVSRLRAAWCVLFRS